MMDRRRGEGGFLLVETGLMRELVLESSLIT